MMLRNCRLLLVHVTIRLSYHVVTAGLCVGGSDIFAAVRENSPGGLLISRLSISTEPGPGSGPGSRPRTGSGSVRLCLTGTNADWFYLEGRTIRLNSSASRVLDREVLGSVLLAELTCYEDDVMQSRVRVLVEILNENDNKPEFIEETLRPRTVSELLSVDSVVFSLKAFDADGDMISYTIDQSAYDPGWFRIDLPNSGHVVLNRPLDYETRTRLQVLVWAQETNTVLRSNTSALLTLNVQDGDDLYPHFLPCTPITSDPPVCVNPTYTTNITHTHPQDSVLEFSPGPIRAEDGDRGINAPLTFSILSGADGRFVMDSQTGEIRLNRALTENHLETNYTLSVMVCQQDDRLKYSVSWVLVRVLSVNSFRPFFNRTTFRGFLVQSSSPASIVSSYGNQVLQVTAYDPDFPQGRNPHLHYSIQPPSGLYQVTPGGVIIARTDQLQAFDRHIIQVVARDEESGDEASASVDIEVLQRGQAVPRGAFTEQPLFGAVDGRVTGGLTGLLLLLLLSAGLFLLLRSARRRRSRGRSQQGAAVAAGKHPNVVSRPDEPIRAFAQYEADCYHGSQGVYTRRQSLAPPPSSSSSSSAVPPHLHSDLEEAPPPSGVQVTTGQSEEEKKPDS